MTERDDDGRAAYEREDTWLSMAIAGAILFTASGAFLTGWVIEASTGPDLLQRVQTVSPLGVLAVAAITFATVVWRGLISARQANISQRQIEGLTRQIAINEESGLASLMQKGAELIADENQAKRSAGLATLEAVAAADTPKFKDPSRRLLLEFIRTYGHKDHSGRLVQQAIAGLNAGFRKHSALLNESIHFEMDEKLAAVHEDYYANWHMVEGVARVMYSGGLMVGQRIAKGCGSVAFSYVQFSGCIIEDFSSCAWDRCRFTNCEFGRIHTDDLAEHLFENCNFSQTQIVFNQAMPDLRKGDNFYLASFPPIAVANTGPNAVWNDVLLLFDEIGMIEDVS
ncbi:hypothetical protein LB566_03325 [Mesorhizobium sp. CA13]|uniref:hypothetical protein n=1 Tax=Mesorhizobium sp. CA13 TaxID=2876643 RepID=UPI001CCA67EC|nr:hypothetical protein [Mesorhizobium sp. CA13]MBZ9852814.1 hypothetical protein [Mesorhizobium sp. CA13]